MSVPAPLKPYQQYINRANELANVDPVVAYYCRMYVVQECISMYSAATEETREYLNELMSSLEQVKKALPDSPLLGSESEEAAIYVENFAHKVFKGADDEDRAGVASIGTALRFRAASNFYQVLRVFGPLAADIEEKKKYAKWKAVQISKAIKAGKQPRPGGPQEHKEEDEARAAAAAAEAQAAAAAARGDSSPSQPPSSGPAVDEFGLPIIPSANSNPAPKPSSGPAFDEFGLPIVPSANSNPAPKPSSGPAFDEFGLPIVPSANSNPAPKPSSGPAFDEFGLPIVPSANSNPAPKPSSGPAFDEFGLPIVPSANSNPAPKPSSGPAVDEFGLPITPSANPSQGVAPNSGPLPPSFGGGSSGPAPHIPGPGVDLTPTPPPAHNFGPAPPAAAPAPAPAATAAQTSHPGIIRITPLPGYKPTVKQKNQATKFASYVSSSLAFHDIDGAIENLTSALALLTGLQFEKQ
ncbi:uncharacterized protein AMSG_11383 [Thecamonas trahens ATCC 50062]|uniref:Vacuolar protein sorting-associated protein VTA1 n=1 Tax=Thecamonas trahens ATCC 50062 TaxID=461836 RepID=A0A0L0DV09_THETB|nr:hypothetical protein AMSG_11383 [Thecamonas trahens ATCC 50062]KNC55916.1 hypothetical protein AMSG_11383 [Thecamonas trahens ATCC 50062]|eukprot:XP_013752734.1 hypothetical protein AMSG_11383 [Thecamonas trahens ATCC 50062]